ncbi:MAG: Gfo/Idh/MocA family oxidoreductase [Gemmatimonadota bacterium]|jgi:predicted dehydrogenase
MTPSPHEETPRNRLRVGLVGCGWIAEIAHLPALSASRHAGLAAVCEPDPERREWIRERFPGVPTVELAALLDDDRIDAVVVAVPTARHAEVAEAAFAAGKHVYVEKPLAVRMSEGRRVVRAWEASGRVGMVGYNFRRSPVVPHAGKVVREGRIGALREIQATFLWAADRIEGWRSDPDAGGGALLDLASHHFDLVHALTGQRIRSVRCNLRSIRTAEDSVSAEGSLEGDACAHMLASYVTGVQVNRLELFGATGSLLVDLLDPLPNPIVRRPGPGARLRRAARAAGRLHPRRLLHPPWREPSFARSLEAFFAAALRNEQVAPTPRDGLHALAVSEAARRSAVRDGASVEVESASADSPGPGGAR